MSDSMRPGISQQITFLYTRNLTQTAHFYEDVLALPAVLDQADCRVYRVNGEAYLGFCERAEAPVMVSDREPIASEALHVQAGLLFTLVTDDVDAWYERLVAHGVEVTKPPALSERYGIYHCYVRDPNGYTLEIQRFLDPAWQKVLDEVEDQE